MKPKEDEGLALPGLEAQEPGASAQNPISVADLTADIRELLETGIGEVWVRGGDFQFARAGLGASLLHVEGRDRDARGGDVPARGAACGSRACGTGRRCLCAGRSRSTRRAGNTRSRSRKSARAGRKPATALRGTEAQARGGGPLRAGTQARPARFSGDDRRGHVAAGRGVAGHAQRAQAARGRALPSACAVCACRVPRRVAEIAAAVCGVQRRGRDRPARRRAWRREPGGFMGVQRGAGGARPGGVRGADHFRRGPRDRFHHRRFRRGPARADAERRGGVADARLGGVARGRRKTAGAARPHDAAGAGEHRRELARLASSYALREPRRVVRQWAQRLDDLRESLRDGALHAILERRQALQLLRTQLAAHHPAREIARRREHLGHLAARLRTLGPQGTLDRGYALVLDAAGHPIAQAKAELEGQAVRIVFGKGVAGAKLTEPQPGKTLIDALRPPGVGDAGEKKAKPRRKKAS